MQKQQKMPLNKAEKAFLGEKKEEKEPQVVFYLNICYGSEIIASFTSNSVLLSISASVSTGHPVIVCVLSDVKIFNQNHFNMVKMKYIYQLNTERLVMSTMGSTPDGYWWVVSSNPPE